MRIRISGRRLRAVRPARAAALTAAALLVVGCATPAPRAPATAEARLGEALATLPGAPSRAAAHRLARAALAATDALAARYRPLRSPLLGNLAYHLGLRERALCCHWAEDLLRALAALPPRGYELHWAVAHFGSRLREHSAVLVVPAGGAPEHGLVLDAWRDAGRLVWARADADAYRWRLHPSDAQRHRLRCGAERRD